ncbi:MAG: hypothetical protein ACLPTF_12860 [Steroidobacteraceae bacterium]
MNNESNQSHNWYLRKAKRFGYWFLLAIALASYGTFTFQKESRYWPNSHGQFITWDRALRMSLGTLMFGVVLALLVGVCTGGIKYSASRGPFTVFNAGFWITFCTTSFLSDSILPKMF